MYREDSSLVLGESTQSFLLAAQDVIRLKNEVLDVFITDKLDSPYGSGSKLLLGLRIEKQEVCPHWFSFFPFKTLGTPFSPKFALKLMQ